MFGEVKDILKVASIYMATVIGAGFASGQEIMQFFSSYYEGGFYGIILAGILFALIGYIVLVKVHSERIRNYEEFLFPTAGWVIGWIMEIMVTLFMGSVLCIMVAGAGNIISGAINIPYHYATLIAAILCMIVFLTDIKGIVVLSSFVTPVLVLGILGAGFYVIANMDIWVFNPVDGFNAITDNWLVSSLLYVSYNSISGVVVMCSLLPYLKSRRIAAAGGIVGGLTLSFIAIILNIILYLFYPDIISEEIPVLSVIGRYNSALGGFYRILLLLAMFIAAVTSGYGFIERIANKVRISRKILIPVICGFVVPISNVGFSGLISSVYPIFGYIGMFMMFMILFQGLNMLFSRLSACFAPVSSKRVYKNRDR
ncbi:MAG TPA: hypothetical protein PLH43_05675 [Acetivibrio sp.]|uniref:YkvI family membrane protein n=1 Tax=Acetivibrio sp. TaxID=1872092 RepID=UPI002BB15153|nr:hypothetical protein [Acetivibrio sp.]HOM02301.1 hypothetical protein [Acetivibrio sp.]